jgi:hypothetical protein
MGLFGMAEATLKIALKIFTGAKSLPKAMAQFF